MKYAYPVVLMLLLVFANPSLAAEVWQVGKHEVPLPAGASEALRKAIAETPVPDRATRLKFPSNDAEWLAAKAARDRATAIGSKELADLFQVKVEKKQTDGVNVAVLAPARTRDANMKRLFIHVHGGAYVYNGGDASMAEGIIIAGRLGISVVSIDYRMPPEHPFPAAVDDVVTVYKQLLKQHSPASMIIGGTSAGGGLALASVHKFRQMGLPSPGAVFAGTAWADLTKTGDSLYTNEGIDRILVTYDGELDAAAKLYAGGEDLKDPLISPVYGTFEDYPPTILVTGTRDLFLSDVSRTHRKMRAAGVEADLHVYEGMSHADYVFVLDSPESVDMFNELGRFVDKHLARD
jgi:acetyl esterase/lipase